MKADNIPNGYKASPVTQHYELTKRFDLKLGPAGSAQGPLGFLLYVSLHLKRIQFHTYRLNRAGTEDEIQYRLLLHGASFNLKKRKKNNLDKKPSALSHLFPMCLHWWIGSWTISFRLKSLTRTANRNEIKKKSAAILDARGPDSGCVLLKINRKCFVFPSGPILWIFSSATASPIHVFRCACMCDRERERERYELNKWQNKQTTSRNLIFTTMRLWAGRATNLAVNGFYSRFPVSPHAYVLMYDPWDKVLNLDWSS